jgi:hypothetical protein
VCSPAGRSTDPRDYPVGRAEYALRDVTTLTAKASAAGPAVGVYVVRLLDTPLPWTRMRMVYRLLGLVRSYGPTPVDAARGRALELDVVDVTKIARMLEQASERRKSRDERSAVRPRPGRVRRQWADLRRWGDAGRTRGRSAYPSRRSDAVLVRPLVRLH